MMGKIKTKKKTTFVIPERDMLYMQRTSVGLGYFLLVEESPKPKHLRLLRL